MQTFGLIGRPILYLARRSEPLILASALSATATTAASNGSVNSMYDAYTPLGGLVTLLLMTRGVLTICSIANDVAKYFAIIPAAFAATYPALAALNFMGLATPQSAILSAVIFNALVIIVLVPLALRGVPYRPLPAARLLRDNLLIYGGGGLITPFIGIKIIDLILVVLGLV